MMLADKDLRRMTWLAIVLGEEYLDCFGFFFNEMQRETLQKDFDRLKKLSEPPVEPIE